MDPCNAFGWMLRSWGRQWRCFLCSDSSQEWMFRGFLWGGVLWRVISARGIPVVGVPVSVYLPGSAKSSAFAPALPSPESLSQVETLNRGDRRAARSRAGG